MGKLTALLPPSAGNEPQQLGPPSSSAAPPTSASSELRPRSNFTAIMQPQRGCLAVVRGPGYDVVVGSGVLGRVRVAPLPPRSNDDYAEYFPHACDVVQVRGATRWSCRVGLA